jgi:hypothetical protein
MKCIISDRIRELIAQMKILAAEHKVDQGHHLGLRFEDFEVFAQMMWNGELDYLRVRFRDHEIWFDHDGSIHQMDEIAIDGIDDEMHNQLCYCLLTLSVLDYW